MAKKEKSEETLEEKQGMDASAMAMLAFNKKNKDSFLDPKDFVKWRSSTGSLLLDAAIGGGFTPGVVVIGGASKGGKTSSILEFVKNALKMENAKAIYYDCEGRVTDEMIASSGIKMVLEEKDWAKNTCLLKYPKNYEVILDGINNSISTQEGVPKAERIKFIFVVDSLDTLVGKEDANKGVGDAAKVGGGAVIMSKFFKKSNMILNKLGHLLFLVKQVREAIEIDKYAAKKQNASVGGNAPNAVIHAANHIWEYQGRTKTANIMEGEDIVGHHCHIKLKKSNKEDVNVLVKYPVKHILKKSNGDDVGCVWLEMEIADSLIQWGFVSQAGSWIAFEEDFIQELKDQGFTVEDGFKIQGLPKLKLWLEQNPDIMEYLYAKFLKMFSEV